MQILNYKDSNFQDKLNQILINNEEFDAQITEDVKNIIQLVKNEQDEAIIEICNKFDQANFKNPQDLIVKKSEIDNAFKNINPKILESLKLAHDRIKSYHEKQLPIDFEYKDEIGVTLGNRWQAIESICVYAPGGTAIYPSSILMSAIPAITAGVKK